MKKIYNLLIATMVFQMTNVAHAIDLNPRLKNTDKSLFNSHPNIDIKDGYGNFIFELNNATSPLVIRNKTTGNIDPLINHLYSLDLGINYGLTSWLQVGALLPYEMPQGGEKNSSYIQGPYLEAKIKLFKNFALVPSYQAPSSGTVTINGPQGIESVKMGAPSGSYGAKIVSQHGSRGDFVWGTQLGYYMSPDNQYRTIDQTSTILAGVSALMNMSESFDVGTEAIVQKLPEAMPIEVNGFVNLRSGDWNYQMGVGTGNIQGSGSNNVRAFFGITMLFGGPSKSSRGSFPVLRRNSRPTLKPNSKVPQGQEMLEDSFDEQTGPDVLDNPGDAPEPLIQDVMNNKQPSPSRFIASVTVEEYPKKASLPNGQRVKIFKDHISEMPTDIDVMYTTEKGYQEAVKKQKEEIKKNGKIKKYVKKNTKNQNLVETPKTVVEEKTNIELLEKEELVQEIKEAPVMKIKEKDPELMIKEHIVSDVSDEVKIVPVDLEQLKEKQKISLEAKQSESKEESKVEVSDSKKQEEVPVVKISLEQREILKKEISKDFENMSLETKRQEISAKVLEEQKKLNETMDNKLAEELKLKEEQEKAAADKLMAEKQKDIRENAPLAEDSELAGKAATKEELKPIVIKDKRKRPILVSLPQAQLDSFVSGKKIPKLPASEAKKKVNLLEEDYGIEEANGPSVGMEY